MKKAFSIFFFYSTLLVAGTFHSWEFNKRYGANSYIYSIPFYFNNKKRTAPIALTLKNSDTQKETLIDSRQEKTESTIKQDHRKHEAVPNEKI